MFSFSITAFEMFHLGKRIMVDSSLGGFKRLGQRLFGKEKPTERPAHVKMERRAGRRVPLALSVRLRLDNGSMQDGRVRDVNLSGLAIERTGDLAVGERLSIAFDGYPDVSPAFALVAHARREITSEEPASSDAIGIEIDRDATPKESMRNYRSLVRHYLHHRPLLDDMNKGYFEGRCPQCEWIGRVGVGTPVCSRCGSAVVPV